MKKDKYKEIIKNLISVGIEFKMHKNYPVIYCKQKIDPQILEIAKNNREGIARELIKEKQELISEEAKLAFPIEEGIPILIVEEARKIDDK